MSEGSIDKMKKYETEMDRLYNQFLSQTTGQSRLDFQPRPLPSPKSYVFLNEGVLWAWLKQNGPVRAELLRSGLFVVRDFRPNEPVTVELVRDEGYIFGYPVAVIRDKGPYITATSVDKARRSNPTLDLFTSIEPSENDLAAAGFAPIMDAERFKREFLSAWQSVEADVLTGKADATLSVADSFEKDLRDAGAWYGTAAETVLHRYDGLIVCECDDENCPYDIDITADEYRKASGDGGWWRLTHPKCTSGVLGRTLSARTDRWYVWQ